MAPKSRGGPVRIFGSPDFCPDVWWPGPLSGFFMVRTYDPEIRTRTGPSYIRTEFRTTYRSERNRGSLRTDGPPTLAQVSYPELLLIVNIYNLIALDHVPSLYPTKCCDVFETEVSLFWK